LIRRSSCLRALKLYSDLYSAAIEDLLFDGPP
jgi:hypothetical protein